MKRKYRKAVYNVLSAIWLILASPLLMLCFICEGLVVICGYIGVKPIDWLKTKLRVYDTDPE